MQSGFSRIVHRPGPAKRVQVRAQASLSLPLLKRGKKAQGVHAVSKEDYSLRAKLTFKRRNLSEPTEKQQFCGFSESVLEQQERDQSLLLEQLERRRSLQVKSSLRIFTNASHSQSLFQRIEQLHASSLKVDLWSRDNILKAEEFYRGVTQQMLRLIQQVERENEELRIRTEKVLPRESLHQQLTYSRRVKQLEEESSVVREYHVLIYKLVLKCGRDVRRDGLVWLVRQLHQLGVAIKPELFPEYLDKQSVDYLLEKHTLLLEVAQLQRQRLALCARYKSQYWAPEAEAAGQTSRTTSRYWSEFKSLIEEQPHTQNVISRIFARVEEKPYAALKQEALLSRLKALKLAGGYERQQGRSSVIREYLDKSAQVSQRVARLRGATLNEQRRVQRGEGGQRVLVQAALFGTKYLLIW